MDQFYVQQFGGAAAPEAHLQSSALPGQLPTQPMNRGVAFVNQSPYYYAAAGGLPGASSSQFPISALHGTPPAVGSLGTPHFSSAPWQNSPHYASSYGQSTSGIRGSHMSSVGSTAQAGGALAHSLFQSSFASQSHGSVEEAYATMELENLVLVPTRPLLKALARECKPHPPWWVGFLMSASLGEEVERFAEFTTATAEELSVHEASLDTVRRLLATFWPEVELAPMGVTAAGLSPLRDATSHYYTINTASLVPDLEVQLAEAANRGGMQTHFFTDSRAVPCAVLIDSHSSKRFCIRYGSHAERAAPSAAMLQSSIAANPAGRAVLVVILYLLRQNKIIDEVGTEPTLLNGEAVAVMVLAVLNSYDPDDPPDAGRALLDFFLTYGFDTYFNPQQSSVNAAGLATPTPKVHLNAQLSVMDPSDSSTNLTPGIDRVSSLFAVFNYCYTALSQYTQIKSSQRRAQSALSTILGGEPFWKRVLQLHKERVEPYFGAVQGKKAALARCL